MSLLINYDVDYKTSKSHDFNLTINKISELAHEKVGAKTDGQLLTNAQYERGMFLANLIIKNWSGDNIYLWNLNWINLPLFPSDLVNVLGLDYECTRNNLSNLRNIPGSGETWRSFWKVLTTNTAPSWIDNQKYHGKGNYDLDKSILYIDNARIKTNTEEGSYTRLNKTTQKEYFTLGNTLTEGRPDQYFFRFQLQPEVFLFPVPNDVTEYTIEIMAYQYPEDFDSGGDFPDYKPEWIEPLVLALAVKLAPHEGIFGSQLRDLKTEAKESKKMAEKSNRESGDIRMSPNLRRN